MIETTNIPPEGGTMTLEMVLNVAREIAELPPKDYRGSYSGVRVIQNHYALAATTVRKFPVSRHRSARVHKKLLKRFGSEFVMEPTMWSTPMGIVAHPSLYAELERRIVQQKRLLDKEIENTLLYGGWV